MQELCWGGLVNCSCLWTDHKPCFVDKIKKLLELITVANNTKNRHISSLKTALRKTVIKRASRQRTVPIVL